MLPRAPVVAVLDDEPGFRQAMSRLLKTHGYEIALFADGRELVEAASRQQFDCLLLDLHMPEVTGFDVLAQLAEHASRTPVIVITGHDAPGSAERARRLGAVGYLLKPVDQTALLEAMTRATEAEQTPPEAGVPDEKPTPPESM